MFDDNFQVIDGRKTFEEAARHNNTLKTMVEQLVRNAVRSNWQQQGCPPNRYHVDKISFLVLICYMLTGDDSLIEKRGLMLPMLSEVALKNDGSPLKPSAMEERVEI